MTNFLNSAKDLLATIEANRILEVGCGEGFFSTKVTKWKPESCVYGCDIVPSVFDRDIIEANNVLFSVQSAYELAFSAGTFDLILAIEVLEHLTNPRDALKEIRRLNPQFVVFSVPREPFWRFLNIIRFSYLRDWGNTPGHVQHWSKRRFVALISHFFRPLRVVTPLPWTMILAQRY